MRLLDICAAAFALNKAAHKDDALRKVVFPLKCALAKWLYAHGYVERVEPKKQKFRCYHTQEYLRGRDWVCVKCRNSGVFGYKKYLAVRFRVDGCTWSWHLPPEALSGARQVSMWKGGGKDLPVPKSTPRKLAWLVWRWLVVKGGVEIEPPRMENYE